jgi:hypothetical protein
MNTTARRGWLTGAAAALVAVLTLLTVLAVVALADAAGRSSVRVPVATDLVADLGEPTGLADGVTLDPHGTVDLLIDVPTTGETLWSLASWLPSLLIGVTTVSLLLLVVAEARRGTPFSGRTVRCLRAIGLIALLGGPLAILVDGIASGVLTDAVLSGPGDPSPTVTFDWLVVGVGFLALAEVIRRGREMREELDEVI